MEPGTIVGGRYQVEDALGAGAMGAVYRVRHLELDTVRALKVLHRAWDVDRLRVEGRVLARLEHPNVVRVHDLFDLGDGLGLVMELVDGPTLEAWLEGRSPSLAEIERIGQGLCAGLAAAHAAGVLHRDLKPANVLLAPSPAGPVPRIVDFGLAREVGDVAGATGPVSGTPAYMAPEQLHGGGGIPADLWALGCVLQELATGHRVFDGPTVHAVIVRVLSGQRADPRALRPDLPEPMAAALDTLLVQDPAERPRSALDVAWRWRRPETGAPPSAAVPHAARTNIDGDEPLVGRDAALAELLEATAEPGLVTLHGPGGVGKTRLSRALCLEVAAALEGGAWFADLTAATTEAELAATVALALGLPDSPAGASDLVGQALRGRGRVVLVLDNVEQAVDAAADLVRRWSAAAPDATLVVTTREVLRLPGERVLEVGPLSVQAGRALFVARAAEARPGFALDDVETIDAIVAAIDGLPLAIELAAARVRVLPPAGILERLSDRFRLLSGGRRGRPDRQATLRAVLDGSWALLDDIERAALAQASVFAGGFTAETAEAVLDLGDGWVLDVLERLVDKSLLRIAWGREPRYHLLESVRAYAAERLAAGGGRLAAEERHGRAFAALGPRGGGLADVDDVWVACRRAVARRDARVAVGALRTAGGIGAGRIGDLADLALSVLALPLQAALRGPARVVAARAHLVAGRLEEAWDLADLAWADARACGDLALEAEALVLRAGRPGERGRRDEALAWLDEAAELARRARDPVVEVLAESTRGPVLWEAGRLGEAVRHLDALACSRLGLAPPWLQVTVLERLGMARHLAGDAEGSLRVLDRALAVHRAAGLPPAREANILGAAGLARFRAGQLTEARRDLELAVRRAREAGHRNALATQLGNLASVLGTLGEWEAFLAAQTEALAVFRESSDRTGEAMVLGNLGVYWFERREPERAHQHVEAALAIHRELGNRRFVGLSLGQLSNLDRVAGRHDEARAHAEEAVQIARDGGNPRILAAALAALAHAVAEGGDPHAALPLVDEALALVRETRDLAREGRILVVRGQVALLAGDREAAHAAADAAWGIADLLGQASESGLRREVTELRERAGME